MIHKCRCLYAQLNCNPTLIVYVQETTKKLIACYCKLTNEKWFTTFPIAFIHMFSLKEAFLKTQLKSVFGWMQWNILEIFANPIKIQKRNLCSSIFIFIESCSIRLSVGGSNWQCSGYFLSSINCNSRHNFKAYIAYCNIKKKALICFLINEATILVDYCNSCQLMC